ncbi:glycosyl hydrolases family 28-domain-containing protein [Mrakia frigida]|uniref:glycosyl hydrolases family 28-domain-containing protein n=1 Tax=Mrakia frigida TaxID=29902 RepID=UPI003FCBFBF1
MLSSSFALTALLLVGQLAAASDLPDSLVRKASRNPSRRAAGLDCIFTIKSANDTIAAKASKCKTINVEALTVPDATIFDLKNLVDSAVVNLKGNLDVCGKTPWADGPCVQVSGKNVTFNGNGFELYGNGPAFWDTWGGNGGVPKPKFFAVTMSGVFQDLKVRSSPRHVFSIGNSLPLLMQRITVDNSAGNELMLLPGSTDTYLPAGHNSDCFDVSATGTIIQDSWCSNQDDCLAINRGSDITFRRNYCEGGHGISIGSIQKDKSVSNVLIEGNTVVNHTNGLRIKTVVGATNASVSDITYIGNTVIGATEFGVIIQQDYLNGGPTGSPSSDIPITNIKFLGAENTVNVIDGALQVKVLCGNGTCGGDWDWSSLTTTGGLPGYITPLNVPITGYTLST